MGKSYLKLPKTTSGVNRKAAAQVQHGERPGVAPLFEEGCGKKIWEGVSKKKSLLVAEGKVEPSLEKKKRAGPRLGRGSTRPPFLLEREEENCDRARKKKSEHHEEGKMHVDRQSGEGTARNPRNERTTPQTKKEKTKKKKEKNSQKHNGRPGERKDTVFHLKVKEKKYGKQPRHGGRVQWKIVRPGGGEGKKPPDKMSKWRTWLEAVNWRTIRENWSTRDVG